jgi:CubicO group peptidase (beta-lactamase class C family)
MKNRKKMKIKLAVLFMILGNISFAQSRIQKVDKLLDSLYAQQRFNGNILLAENGKIIYSRSLGLANETTKEKINQESIFELASCSKQFTAMGIVILREKGKLNLEDMISKYIPELSNYKGISIKNLLHHTGGLPDYMTLMDTVWDKTKIATNKDIIDFFSKYKPRILFEPNSKNEYSNTGYALLASIIENVSGRTYAEFLKEQIFKPLEMNNSFVYNRRLSPKKVENYAIGYVFNRDENKYILPDDYQRTKMVFWLDGVVGDGTVNSNVIDLLKWDRALYSTKLVSSESLHEIFTNGKLNDGTIGKHGFGWRMLDTKEFGRIAKHSGAWPGYMSYIERDTDKDKTIIILQNHYGVTIPSDEIRNILFNIEKK